jgi:hypothetical protein
MFTDHGEWNQELEEHLMGLGDDLAPAELVLLDVDAELERQDQLWGDQSHLPNGTSEGLRLLADEFRAIADHNHKTGKLSFADILSEEFYEALSETDEEKLEIELIQVAAVASQWVKAIRTRRARVAEDSDALHQ